MARSVWKGPFVHPSLLKKIDKLKDAPNKKPIKTWSRNSTIIPDLLVINLRYIMEKNLYQYLFQKKW